MTHSHLLQGAAIMRVYLCSYLPVGHSHVKLCCRHKLHTEHCGGRSRHVGGLANRGAGEAYLIEIPRNLLRPIPVLCRLKHATRHCARP